MSQITVRYFAAAAEAAGRDEELWELSDARAGAEESGAEASDAGPSRTTTADAEPPTLAALRQRLEERYGAPMAQVLRAGSFLVDGVVRRDGGVIEDAGSGITVDVLPPFAGG